MNHSHFYLLLTVSFSHEYILKVVKVCEFYNYTLSTLSGFYRLQKVRALGELMQSHLCPAVGPVLVQRTPHRQTPRLLRHQFFGSVLIRCPRCRLHSSPFLLQPFTGSPHVQAAAPGPQTENQLLCHLPPSAFPAGPHTHSAALAL